MTRRPTMTAIALASVLLVAACGGGDENGAGGATAAAEESRSTDGPAETVSPSPSPSPTPTPTTPTAGESRDGASPSAPAGGRTGEVLRDTSRKTGAAREAEVNDFPELRGVRVGIHDTYDRVVFDFAGGTPEYVAEYVDELHQDGSGRRIPVEGEHRLQLTFLRSVPDEGLDLKGGGKETPTVRGLRFVSFFEGRILYGVGLDTRGDGPAGFRVTTGENKIILDVAHRAAGSAG